MKNKPVLCHQKITPEELGKFKEIARKDYRIELSDAQATEQATAILICFNILLKRSTKKRDSP